METLGGFALYLNEALVLQKLNLLNSLFQRPAFRDSKQYPWSGFSANDKVAHITKLAYGLLLYLKQSFQVLTA